MKIILNGQEKRVAAPMTIAGLLQEMDLGGRRVAVEVNREIIPRSQHGAFELKDDDRVEVVFAIGGGMSSEPGPREAGGASTSREQAPPAKLVEVTVASRSQPSE